MKIGHLIEFQSQHFEGLLPKHQLWNSQWPIYIINSVDKTKIILLYSPTIAAPQFLKKNLPTLHHRMVW